jgi:predicted dehydrogenase
MRFMIAGLGSIGRRHLRNLVALGERDIVLFRTGLSTLPDDELEGFPTEKNLEEALARSPDAVIIANPTALHLDVAIPAARAGCHVLLEKPVSGTLDGTEGLREAVRSGKGRILVGYQYRFHPGLQAVKSWLEANAVGRVLTAAAEYRDYLPDWHPWEDFRRSYSARADLGGGVILTLSHPVDTLEWLLGPGRVVWAWSAGIPELELETDAVAMIVEELSSGASGVIQLDYLHRPRSHRIEVTGTGGGIRWSEHDGIAHRVGWKPDAEEQAAPLAGFDRNDMFLAEMKHFLNVCRGEESPVCSLEDGLRTLELLVGARALAAKKAAGEGAMRRE